MARKASLQLSINAIVIVVLAFVLLGLGLGFIRSQFSQIGQTTQQVQEQVKQQILDDLRTGDKKLSFPTAQTTISTGESEVVSFGVKNVQDSDLYFCIVIEDLSKVPDGDCDTPIVSSTSANGDYCGGFFWDTTVQRLEPGDAQVLGLKYFAPDKKLTYLYKIQVVSVEDAATDCPTDSVTADEIYDQKTVFANVV